MPLTFTDTSLTFARTINERLAKNFVQRDDGVHTLLTSLSTSAAEPEMQAQDFLYQQVAANNLYEVCHYIFVFWYYDSSAISSTQVLLQRIDSEIALLNRLYESDESRVSLSRFIERRLEVLPPSKRLMQMEFWITRISFKNTVEDSSSLLKWLDGNSARFLSASTGDISVRADMTAAAAESTAVGTGAAAAAGSGGGGGGGAGAGAGAGEAATAEVEKPSSALAFNQWLINQNKLLLSIRSEEGRALLYAALQAEFSARYIPRDSGENRDAYFVRLYYLAKLFNLGEIKNFLIESYATYRENFCKIEAQVIDPRRMKTSKRSDVFAGESKIFCDIQLYLADETKRNPVKRAAIHHLLLNAAWCPTTSLEVITGWLQNENRSQWSEIMQGGTAIRFLGGLGRVAGGLLGSSCDVADIFNACFASPQFRARIAAARFH